MKTIKLPEATIEYEDTGGTGPVIVLLHGLLMDASLWQAVVADLSHDHRCIVPTLPLGAHRIPSDAGDLSVRSVARLVAEFLERLDLSGVTVAGNDTGGALVQLLATEHPARIGAIVLASCDAFDNYPPGLTGKTLVLSGRLPPALFGAFMQQLRLKPLRRLPIAFGWLTKRGDRITRSWLKPVLSDADIRRDTVAILRSIAAQPRLLEQAAPLLAGFDRPALIIWAAGDRVMPPEHGRRLAEILPNARYAEIADSYTLVPLDQPARFAAGVRDFIHQTTGGERLATQGAPDANARRQKSPSQGR